MRALVRLVSVATVASLAALAGCEPRMVAPGDGGAGCTADLDCDDGFECTVDTCAVGGVCQYTVIDSRCAEGETCVVSRGCVSDSACSTSAECSDAHACTVDSCAVGGVCRHEPLDELCTDPALPTCDPTMGCIRGTGCMSPAECDDSVPCTIDSCGASRMCTHTPMDSLCEEGETCNSTTGCFANTDCEVQADCDDGLFCNGAEICDEKFGCLPGDPPACMDSESCTIDSCSDALGRCDFVCDRASTDPRCMAMAGCVSTGPTCSGTFSLEDTLAVPTCAAADVHPSFAALAFDWDGFDMIVTGGSLTMTSASATGTLCPAVDVSYTLGGGCDEIFQLLGEFTDDDTFEGTISVRYVGPGCRLVCPGMYTATFTATRS